MRRKVRSIAKFLVRGKKVGLAGVLLFFSGPLPALLAEDQYEAQVIKVTATVRESPARITLSWPRKNSTGAITVYRKTITADSWGNGYVTLDGSSTRLVDDNVVVGVGYEYRIYCRVTYDASLYDANGYIYAGIGLPPVESRGKVILLVTTNMAAAVPGEIARLEQDLVGDGWSVLRHDIAPQATVGAAATTGEIAVVKGIIQADYNADPGNVKAVFLLGHVAHPKVYAYRPDGHGTSYLPADTHYTMPNVNWTGYLSDSQLTAANVKLTVGRVDMSNNSSVFLLSEAELLRRYLNKDHAFRHRHTAFQTRAVREGALWNETSFRFETLVGVNQVDTLGRWPGVAQTPALWDLGEGLSYNSAVTPSFQAAWNYQSVFGVSGGSGAYDFDESADVLKPSLASASATLTHIYGYHPHRFVHWMNLGETIGNAERLATVNSSLYPQTHANSALMCARGLAGDPTLRMHILAPPVGVTLSGATLSWAASPDSGTDGFSGYSVYRAESLTGTFTRVTATNILDTSWTDPSAPATAVYQVRALRLERSPGGSYYNTSQGVFVNRGSVGIVAESQWLTVVEGGAAALRVKLSSQPASNVTVSAVHAGGDSSISVQSGAALLFTPSNWSNWQAVILTAARDADAVDGSAEIRLSSSGLTTVTVDAVEAENTLVFSSLAPTVPEGGIASTRVKLSAPPAADVTVITQPTGYSYVEGSGIVLQSGSNLTFTADNWNDWQAITFRFPDTNTVPDPQNLDAMTRKFATTAAGYRGVSYDVQGVERHIIIGVVASPASGGAVSPVPGSTDSCVPRGEPVRISAIPNAGYRFAGWSGSQGVVITDPSASNTTATTFFGGAFVTYTITASFVPEGAASTLIAIERNPIAVSVPECGTADVQVRLTAQPASSVTVSASGSSGDANIAVQSGASLTFTTANWANWQTIRLAASADSDTASGGTAITLSGSGLVSSGIWAYEADRDAVLTAYANVGGVSVIPSGRTIVPRGVPTSISAIPNTGFRFDGWVVMSGSAVFADSRAPRTTVTLDADATIRALFVRCERVTATCTLTLPASDIVVRAGSSLTLAAEAEVSSPGATISRVDFLRDGVLIGTATSEPYSFTWSGVPLGTFGITARATDSHGVSADSAAVRICSTSDGQWPGIVASGGDEVYDFTTNAILYRVHKFKTAGLANFKVHGLSGTNAVEYLLIAGGGGGGGNWDGCGGGAGGLLTGSVSVAAQSYAITVGAGGIGGDGGSNGGSNGGDSSLATLATALGGGGGGGTAGQTGGSGGGSDYNNNGGLGAAGQGNDGARGWSEGIYRGGGGGGAGADAVQSSSGTGGSGAASSMTGASVTYATGGNGGSRSFPGNGTDGVANTGNGGNGGGGQGSLGGAGGSGIVVLRYVIPAALAAYPVIYDANGATAGTVPSPQSKGFGSTLILAANTGGLARTGYFFAGWNTAADGSGTDYAAGGSYATHVAVTLYAKWTAASYPVAYSANGATSGEVPAAQTQTHGVALTVATNESLARVGYVFTGWNTADNGTGSDYAPGAAYAVNAAATLYARWMPCGNALPIITNLAATLNPTLLGTTTVAVACNANGGEPHTYAWSQVSGPGAATFSAPYASRSAVSFSSAGTYVLRVIVGNARNELVAQTLTVTAGLIVTDVDSLSVPEGGTNLFRVKLSAVPGADVAVSVVCTGDVGLTVQSATNLTFTTGNWDTWQTVTLAAAEDNTDLADGTALITLTSSGATGAVVVATSADNDTSLRISAGSAGSVSPAGLSIVTKGLPVSILATANAGESFGRWAVLDGSASFGNSEASNTTVTVTAPATIRANFAQASAVVWGWGSGTSGQLGQGTNSNSYTPVPATNLSAAVEIAAGYTHSLARMADGTVMAWGAGSSGQMGDGTNLSRYVPVLVTNLSGITAVAANSHSMALAMDGMVWAWGNNGSGRLGDGTTSNRYVPVLVTNLSDITAIAAGGSHSLALAAGGTVWAWGGNAFGQLGDGSTSNRYVPVMVTNLSGIIAIAAGASHSLALTSDGTVWAWGYNGAGQLGDGTISNRYTPVMVTNLSGVTAIAAGQNHCLALKVDGSVWSWGNNGNMQLGDGTTTPRSIPVAVTNLAGITAIASGGEHCLAIKDNGTVWVWGDNYYYQLGFDPLASDAGVPVQLQISDVIGIAGGRFHSLALSDVQRYVRVVTSVSGISLAEGGTATFQARLSAQPAGTITVAVSRVSGSTNISVQSGMSLTFTTNNWSVNQTVTLAAEEDADAANGDAVVALGGTGVDAVSYVLVTETDNETTLMLAAGLGGTVSPAGAAAVPMGSNTAITATAGSGYVFAGWTLLSGNATIVNPNAATTTVAIVTPATVLANFVPAGENRQPAIVGAAQADPESLILSAASTVRVSAVDPDGDSLTYAWSKVSGVGAVTFGTPNATNSSVTFDEAGTYILRVTVSDGRGGSAVSELTVMVAPLLVTGAPVLSREPSDATVCTNQTVKFSVAAAGGGLSYQWYRNGVPIFSGTGPEYVMPSATMADNGAIFRVTVSNAAGSVTSRDAVLVVLAEPLGTGVIGSYYSDGSFSNLATTRVDAGIPTWGFGAAVPAPGLGNYATQYSVRWTGQFRPKYSEPHTFYLQAEGGSVAKLWINGQLVVNGGGGVAAGGGAITLVAGQKYDFRLDYAHLDTTSGSQLMDQWNSPTLNLPLNGHDNVYPQIPVSQLFPEVSSNHAPTVISVVADPAMVTNPAATTVRVVAIDADTNVLSYAWSQISGPGTATFATPNSTNSTVTFSAGGVYVLRVLVSDGQGGSAIGDVSITVSAGGVAGGITASGGEIVDYTANNIRYRTHTFRTACAANLVVSSLGGGNGQVDYLVVAGGGGGGGGWQGGGGGAGGMLTGTISVATGSISVVVGGGGIGCNRVSDQPAGNGTNSSFGPIVALGGGAGASEGPSRSAASGGSGGGGAHGGGLAGAAGTVGQGCAGGDGNSDQTFSGGGGGGAGGPGSNAVPYASTAPGGPGRASSISGTAVVYASGGQGRMREGLVYDGAPAAAGTGNGGDAGSRVGSLGGNGGSGIVILRYCLGAIAPVITTEPISRTNDPGTAAVFALVADGTAPWVYQWEKDGLAIVDATSAVYRIAAVAESDEGGYRCVVTNAAGAVTSAVAVLTVNDSPAVPVATNGVPLAWLASYGLSTNDVGAWYDDGDSMPAWAEYVAGTDPTNSASTLALGDPAAQAGTRTNDIVLQWQSVTGRVYSVLVSMNLGSGFAVLASNIVSTPPVNVYTDSVKGGVWFYRVNVRKVD